MISKSAYNLYILLTLYSLLQAETAASRIGNVLSMNRENEQLMEEYDRLASDVSEINPQTLNFVEILTGDV